MFTARNTLIAAFLVTACSAVWAMDTGREKGLDTAREKGLESKEHGGQGVLPRTQELTSREQEWKPQIVNSQQLMEWEVLDSQGNELASIHDLVLNANQDKVEYAVLARGGVLGVGETLVAVPCTSLKPHPDKQAFTLTIDKQKFENAPGFTEVNWPNITDQNWARETGDYFKSASTSDLSSERSRTSDPSMADKAGSAATRIKESVMGSTKDDLWTRRVSEISKAKLETQDGRSIGKIENIAIDMTEGRPVYAFLVLDGLNSEEQRNGDRSVVPWETLEFKPEQKAARIDADINTLTSVAFKEGKNPNLSDSQAAQNIYNAFNTEPYWNVFGYVGPEGQKSKLHEGKKTKYEHQMKGDEKHMKGEEKHKEIKPEQEGRRSNY